MSSRTARAGSHTKGKPVKPSLPLQFVVDPKAADPGRPFTAESQQSAASFPENPAASLGATSRIELEDLFEDLMTKSLAQPFHVAAEPIFAHIFSAHESLVWLAKPQSNKFYCPTTGAVIHGEESLVAAAARAQTSVVCTASAESPGNQQLLFPLTVKTGSVIAVVEVLRSVEAPGFGDGDLIIASFLMPKFRIYGSVVFAPSQSVSFAADFAEIASPTDSYGRLSECLIRGFNAKLVDFYSLAKHDGVFQKFDRARGDFVELPRTAVGIALFALKNAQTVNVKTPRYHPNFSIAGDALPDEPLLIGTSEFRDLQFAAALRGRIVSDLFGPGDASRLEGIMPFIVRSLYFSTGAGTRAEPDGAARGRADGARGTAVEYLSAR
jgi:hypothetical protein